MKRIEINIHEKELCVRLVSYKDYSEMHGQQNIKPNIRGSIPCRERDVSLPRRVQDDSAGPPSLLFNVHRGYIAGTKTTGP